MALGFLSGALSAGLSFLGGQESGKQAARAAREAAQMQLQGQREAIRAQELAREQQEAFITRQTERALQEAAPFRQLGLEASQQLLSRAQQPLSLTSPVIREAFAQQQAEQLGQLRRGLAARQGLRSGAALEQERLLGTRLGTQEALAQIQQRNLEAAQQRQILSQLAGFGPQTAGLQAGLLGRAGQSLAGIAGGFGRSAADIALRGGATRAGLAGQLGQIGAQQALANAILGQQLVQGAGQSLGRAGFGAPAAPTGTSLANLFGGLGGIV
jgi:hypothetical protein